MSEGLMEIRPGSAIAHRGLGQVRAMKGEMAAAIDHFDLAVQIEPTTRPGAICWASPCS